MVVLVTGGSGFIGSHLIDELLREGYTVRVYDKTRPLQTEVDWYKGDVLSKEDVHEAMRDVETLFHLAAVSDVNVADTDPELCVRVNELGTLNLLRACSGRDVERLILTSTVWVYGNSNKTVTEETPIPLPGNLYTKTKIGQEQLAYSWSQTHSLPYTILRCDIPYGPRMRANMAIATFVRKVMREEPITIFGDGRQGRCWVFVTDLAQAHCLAMKPAAINQTINLAGKDFATISDIVGLLSRTFGSFPVNREPQRLGDFSGVITSIEKAQKLLGWTPTTPFVEGLSKYIEYVRGSAKKEQLGASFPGAGSGM